MMLAHLFNHLSALVLQRRLRRLGYLRQARRRDRRRAAVNLTALVERRHAVRQVDGVVVWPSTRRLDASRDHRRLAAVGCTRFLDDFRQRRRRSFDDDALGDWRRRSTAFLDDDGIALRRRRSAASFPARSIAQRRERDSCAS